MDAVLTSPDPVVRREHPPGWPATPRRFREQRWLVDLAIRTTGVDWDQGRSRYLAASCGTEAEPDFTRVREQVTKLVDINRVFSAGARARDARAAAEAEAGHARTAARHSFVASILWGAAEWPFFVAPEAARRAFEANGLKIAAYRRYMTGADHDVQAHQIEFGDVRLSAYLHLPPNASGPVPCVVHFGGMDSFKSMLSLSMATDSWSGESLGSCSTAQVRATRSTRAYS